jgi:hypothetical protein
MSKKKKPAQQHSNIDLAFQKECEAQFGTEVIDLFDAPDEMKISAKLIEMAEPFDVDQIGYHLLYDCAAIAWNESVTEEHGGEATLVLNNMLCNYANHREMIDILKKRKQLLFPSDVRIIQRVKVVETARGEYNVNVAGQINMEHIMKRFAKLAGKPDALADRTQADARAQTTDENTES